MKKFIKGPEMAMTARLVSSRLGFTYSLSVGKYSLIIDKQNLNRSSTLHLKICLLHLCTDEIQLIHKMCAYDKGLDFNSTSLPHLGVLLYLKRIFWSWSTFVI